MRDKTTHRIAVTVTFVSDGPGAVVASKLLDQALNLPEHLDALSWHEYDVDDDEVNTDGEG